MLRSFNEKQNQSRVICSAFILRSHRMVEGALRGHLMQSFCVQSGFNTFRDKDSSLGNLFQCLISLRVKTVFSYIQLECLVFQFVSIASHPSLDTSDKNLSLRSLLHLFKYLYTLINFPEASLPPPDQSLLS